MRVAVNGHDLDISDGTSLLALIEQHAGSARGSAVVVDGVVVPRRTWPDYAVRPGQHIELITAVPGG
ncbi:MAG TPA: sulfur carrier protein ThiS [Jatrophihabitans sp.]|jgi:sulfur carrier protein